MKLTIGSDKTIIQTPRNLGANPNTLHTWINKYSQPKTRSNTVRTDEHLYEELKATEEGKRPINRERELLKKRRKNHGARNLKESIINRERQDS